MTYAGSPSRAARSMCGPPGKRQTQQPGHLVERLPGGVVDGGAERPHVAGDVGHQQQRGVPAGDEQCDGRLRQRAVFERVDGDMRGQMIDAVERFAERDGQRLGRRDADQQGAGETRAR